MAPRKTAAKPKEREFFSAGKYTEFKDGKLVDDLTLRSKIRAIKDAARGANFTGDKLAGLFSDGELGPANIADSGNIGMYSFEFPVDSMEMPQSRAEELRFYRLAYDRDPIVGRAIDMHAEIPLSKMAMEKPKCSVDSFSDFIYDYFQRLINDTRLFATLIQATRERQTIGETFLFVQEPKLTEGFKLCDEAKKALQKGRGYMAGMSPMSESENAPVVGQEKELTESWIDLKKKKRSSFMKRARQDGTLAQFREANIEFNPDEDIDAVGRQMGRFRRRLAKLRKQAKLHKATLIRSDHADDEAPNKLIITAAPGDPPDTPPGDAAPPADAGAGVGDATPEGTPPDPEGGFDDGMGGGGFDAGFGGGGGGGFGGDPGAPPGDAPSQALVVGEAAIREREISNLKRYLHLLEKKKELLEEFQDILERKRTEKELFQHVCNQDYEGFEQIQMLPPEQIEIESNPLQGGIDIYYKPSEQEKASYLEDKETPTDIRDSLSEGKGILLNQNPFKGSYVIHFARMKAGYEKHGRSILQRCIRTIIYREKLRQVQTTLASRNMTPKSLVTADGVSAAQVSELRSHVDEAKADPDYAIVTNYAVNWQEIGSEGRLLALADEWQHTNSDLAIGLGFSPEILIGEGLYGGNRIQLDLMATAYVQFREELTNMLENHIFKPIAMKKGFYELDDYGRPRWIYPKVTFGRMALRDSGDMFDMLMNLYSKGSLPISVILEYMEIDPETVKRQLEEDLFTVNDSKFNDALTNVYSAVGQAIVDRTDIVNRLAKGMTLKENDIEDEGMEGSGEGM